MRFLDAIVPRPKAAFEQPPFWSLDDARMPFLTTWGLKPDREPIGNDFEAYVRNAYQANGVVFACVAARARVFSGVRFMWRDFDTTTGLPGALYSNAELDLLRTPWRFGTTGEMASRMEVDVSAAGNNYLTTADDRGRIGNASRGGPGRRVVRMRPDWVTLVIGSNSGDPFALDAKVVAAQFWPRGVGVDESKAVLLLPDEFSHYAPHPDPLARWRGMSWLTPVIREIEADKGATKHKLKFFQHGATPQVVVQLPKEITPENFYKYADLMDARHSGAENAYRTLYTAGGADVTVVGKDLKELDFSATQGAGEVRIAMAAGVPPSVLGALKGLEGSSLNAGNAGENRREFASGTVRSLWELAAPSLQALVKSPNPRAQLWYDASDNAYLREDAQKQAETSKLYAEALSSLIQAGWKPDAAVEYLRTADLTKLTGQHSGMYSVQLQPAGAQQPGALDARGMAALAQLLNSRALPPAPLPAPEGSPDAA